MSVYDIETERVKNFIKRRHIELLIIKLIKIKDELHLFDNLYTTIKIPKNLYVILDNEIRTLKSKIWTYLIFIR